MINLENSFFDPTAGGTVACKRKEDPRSPDHVAQPKKPRLVFTDLQRRTLQAIFKVILQEFFLFWPVFASVQLLNQLFSNNENLSGNKAAVQGNGCHHRPSALSPSNDRWKLLHELPSPVIGDRKSVV